jgi:ribosomal protein S18 acetylase RimI-like enzyme
MPFVCLHDKGAIERYLREDVYLHIYSIGDLDDFFWPRTLWFGSKSSEELDAVALLYVGGSLPTLLALSEHVHTMLRLLGSVEHLLPSNFYAHFSPGLESAFSAGYDFEPRGEHYKLALRDKAIAAEYDCSGVVPLVNSDLDELLDFYEKSYPGNWFDPRMLATGQYFGMRDAGSLVSVAGVHVYSPDYGVAALGNVATLPSYRKRGYATQATAKLCQSLLQDVEHIGANVKATNKAALSCYQRLGFEVVATYEELVYKKKIGA